MNAIKTRDDRTTAKLALGALAIGSLWLFQSAAMAQATYSGSSRYDVSRQSYMPGTASGYLGVAGGNSKFDSDCLPGSTCDDKETAFKVTLGGLRSERYGLELGYLNFGRAQNGPNRQEAQGLNLSVVGYLPFDSGFTLFGKVGGTYGYTDTDASLPGDSAGTEQGFGLGYGVGAGYRFTDHVELTLEWESHRFKFSSSDQDLEMATLGLRYHF